MGPSVLLLCLLAQDLPSGTGTLSQEFELVCERFEVPRGGERFDFEGYFGDFRFVISGERLATWRDAPVPDAQGIERTFERLQGRYVLSLESDAAPKIEQVLLLNSPLVGQRLLGERERYGWTFRYLDEDPPKAVWLEGLALTRGLQGLAPKEEDQHAWYLDDVAVAGWMSPFGDPIIEPEAVDGFYPGEAYLLAWTMDPVRHLPLEDLRLRAELGSADGAAEVGLDLDGEANLWFSTLHQADRLHIDESILTWVETTNVTWTWEGLGALEGLGQEATPLEAEFEADLSAVLEIAVYGLVFRLYFDGTVKQTQTWVM